MVFPPRDGLELVDAWRKSFRGGRRERLRWLLTRPFALDGRGTRSRSPPQGLWATLDLSTVLARAFPGWGLAVSTTHVHEHRVILEASVEGAHTGPLDLRAFGQGVFPSTGRSLRIPAQQIAFDLVHQRVHRVEVVDGPGFGLDLILERMDLDPEAALTGEAAWEHLRDEPDPSAKQAQSEEEQAPAEAITPLPERREVPLERRIDHVITKHRRAKRRARLARRSRAGSR